MTIFLYILNRRRLHIFLENKTFSGPTMCFQLVIQLIESGTGNGQGKLPATFRNGTHTSGDKQKARRRDAEQIKLAEYVTICFVHSI